MVRPLVSKTYSSLESKAKAAFSPDFNDSKLVKLVVFSSTVQAHCDELVSAGAHALKGIAEPVPVWVVPS